MIKTSVYLSNNIVRIVVGNCISHNALQIKKQFQLVLPEGALINGTVTDEELLETELKKIWTEKKLPTKNVTLCISSSQIAHKNLTLPVLKWKQLKSTIEKELEDNSNRRTSLYYAECRKVLENKTAEYLVTAVDKGQISPLIRIFKRMHVSIDEITAAVNGEASFLNLVQDFQSQKCIVEVFDDNYLISILWVEGSYIYSNRTRIFGERGSEDFVREVSQVTNTIVQFFMGNNRGEQLDAVYISGITEEERMEIGTVFERANIPLKDMILKKGIKISEYTKTESLGSLLYIIGNMFAKKEKVTLLSEYHDTEKKPQKQKEILKMALPTLVMFAVFSVSSVFLVARNIVLQYRTDTIMRYVSEEKNVQQNLDSLKYQNAIRELENRENQLNAAKEAVESYPMLDAKVMRQIENIGSQYGTVRVNNYDAETGTLQMDANTNRVENISQFIDALTKSGMFEYIDYSGYTYEESLGTYRINLICYMMESAGK